MTTKKTTSASRRDHLANERTFLAWIRTSIGVMAFGFVVEKFALFIKQIGYFLANQGLPQVRDFSYEKAGYSPIFGILLVAIGALIGLLSFIKYLQVETQIEEEHYSYSRKLAISITALIVLVGVFLVVYLLET
jgi:putative membrane protein